MLKKVIFLLFVTVKLFSVTLSDTYYVNSENIKLLSIVPHAEYDVTLYKIDRNRDTKRVKAKDLIKLLKEHGIKSVESSSRYIKFIKKSPIDTSIIKHKIIQIYKEKYPDIQINSVFIMPRSYIKSLPKKYEITVKTKAYLSNKGIFYIKTPEHRKIFFNYTINAKINVYISRGTIKKGTRISALNTSRKNITFKKLKAIPVNIEQINTTQMKRHFKQNSIITMRDIDKLNLVKKGSKVLVSLKNKAISISFSAKALQNGKLNDIITVKKNNGKKIRVIIVEKNRVEIR
ncbi:MAG: flagellar basal body P-ring formation protein FlgA [Sulfurimonas sp.]|nr:flagellar basal body P-ring formation protein FlgA [Sulfurimonas sp.]